MTCFIHNEFTVLIIVHSITVNSNNKSWILRYCNVSVSTHSSHQIHLTGPHTHPLGHISMRMEGTCHSDKQTEGRDTALCLESVMYQQQINPYRVAQVKLNVNHLAGSAAGHALLVVSWQVEVGGTGTLVASSRWEQTQVTAASIVDLTWMIRHCRVEKTCTPGSEGFGAANSPHRDSRSLWPSHLTDLYSVRTLEHLAGSGHSGYEYPSIS